MPKRQRSFYEQDAWRKLSRQVRLEEPICYEPGCGQPSTSADHIVPVLEWPAGGLRRDNVRGSCSKHNMGRVAPRYAQMAKISRRPAEVRPW